MPTFITGNNLTEKREDYLYKVQEVSTTLWENPNPTIAMGESTTDYSPDNTSGSMVWMNSGTAADLSDNVLNYEYLKIEWKDNINSNSINSRYWKISSLDNSTISYNSTNAPYEKLIGSNKLGGNWRFWDFKIRSGLSVDGSTIYSYNYSTINFRDTETNTNIIPTAIYGINYGVTKIEEE